MIVRQTRGYLEDVVNACIVGLRVMFWIVDADLRWFLSVLWFQDMQEKFHVMCDTASCMLYIPVSALLDATQRGTLHYLWMFTHVYMLNSELFVLNVFQPFKVGSQMCRNLPFWIDQLPHEGWYWPDQSATIKKPSKGTLTLRLTHCPFFG